MKIQLNPAKQIVVIAEQTKEFSELEVLFVTDKPSRKEVVANIKGVGNVVLWKGADYDAIGQWTDNDVVTKLNQIYG